MGISKDISNLKKSVLDSFSDYSLDVALKQVFNYWVGKSHLIQKYYKIKDAKYKKDVKALKNSDKGFVYIHTQIRERLSWKPDKLSTGGDTIELPETTWRRKGADCDGLAAFMYYVFGKLITWGSDTYKFDGFRALLGKSAHIVAVYKMFDDDGVRYLILSNTDKYEMNESEYIEYVKSFGGYEIYLDEDMKYKKFRRY